jgi:CMP-N,N'-diacetyllegionaminic acid synthase
MQRILGLIPARGGSKGVPGKNIRLLAGKPLLYYTACMAQRSKLLTTTILSSEDEAIIKVANDLGIRVPFQRPTNLAEDTTPTLPVIIHALLEMEALGETFDAVCLLQTTSPMRPDGMIDMAIEKFLETGADALISVRKVPHEFNPHWVFEPGPDGFLKIATGEETIIPRRQDLPPAFIRDGSIYITRTSVIMEHYSLFGKKTTWLQSDEANYLNIDTVSDWALAEDKIKSLGIS